MPWGEVVDQCSLCKVVRLRTEQVDPTADCTGSATETWVSGETLELEIGHAEESDS